MKVYSQRGQVLIGALLVLFLVSIIVLAVASRSITDIKISQTSEESARAFSAAEAGVETALEQLRAGADPAGIIGKDKLTNDATVDYSVEQVGDSNLAFLSPSPLSSDLQSLQVFLSNTDNPESNNYRGEHICLLWGNEGASQVPAIEATVVYTNTSDEITSQRFVFDPNERDGLPKNVAGNCSLIYAASENNLGVSRNFAYAHELNLLPGVGNPADIKNCAAGTRCLHMLRLRLLYNSSEAQYAGVIPVAGSSLPPQGYKISSTGTTASGTTRKVEVFRSFETLPAIFDFAFYNYEGEVTKWKN